MPDFTSSKSKIFHSESQALTLNLNSPLCKSIWLKTCTELLIFIFLAFIWPYALSLTSLNCILDAKAAKKTFLAVTFLLQTEARSGAYIRTSAWLRSTGSSGQGPKRSQTQEWRLTFEYVVIQDCLWKFR